MGNRYEQAEHRKENQNGQYLWEHSDQDNAKIKLLEDRIMHPPVTKYWWGCRTRRYLMFCSWENFTGTTTWETIWQNLVQLRICLPYYVHLANHPIGLLTPVKLWGSQISLYIFEILPWMEIMCSLTDALNTLCKCISYIIDGGINTKV